MLGYEPTRQTGSQIRLTRGIQGSQHHVTIPRPDLLKIGTLAAIPADVAAYLELYRSDLADQLFRR